jgi:hypothetical protein
MAALISKTIEEPRGVDYYLDKRAAQLRSLANEHRSSGRDATAKKLTWVADELAARAVKLRARTPSRLRRAADGDAAP